MTSQRPRPDLIHVPRDAYHFFIPGEVEPAGSPKPVFLGGDRKRLAIRWQKGHKWTARVRKHLLEEIPESDRPLVVGPAGVWLEFHMLSPHKPKFPVPATPPDIDKVERSTLDGFVWRDKGQKQHPLLLDDDARIVALGKTERYATAEEQLGVGVWVWSWPLM